MLAQVVHAWGDMRTWSVGHFAIAVIIIAAVVAVVLIALRQFGITVPPWVVQLLWIVGVAFVCIVAIRILLSI